MKENALAVVGYQDNYGSRPLQVAKREYSLQRDGNYRGAMTAAAIAIYAGTKELSKTLANVPNNLAQTGISLYTAGTMVVNDLVHSGKSWLKG